MSQNTTPPTPAEIAALQTRADDASRDFATAASKLMAATGSEIDGALGALEIAARRLARSRREDVPRLNRALARMPLSPPTLFYSRTALVDALGEEYVSRIEREATAPVFPVHGPIQMITVGGEPTTTIAGESAMPMLHRDPYLNGLYRALKTGYGFDLRVGDVVNQIEDPMPRLVVTRDGREVCNVPCVESDHG